MTGTPRAPADDIAEQVRRDAAALIGSPEQGRPLGRYRELRDRLAQVPEEERGIGWFEASVLNDVVFRRRPKLARRRLERVFAMRRAAGGEAAAAAWWQEFHAAVQPFALGTHGYRPALATRDAESLWAEASTVAAELTARGYPAYANSGTLLGIVREGGLIGHDDDIDLALLLTSHDPHAAAEEWNALRERLETDGLLDDELRWDTFVHVKIRTESGIVMDLFPSWVEEGRAFVWPHTPGTAAADDLLPLATVTMAGHPIAVPRRPEPFLESNYGPGWREPDPSWRFDWEAARARFPEGWTKYAARGHGWLDTGDEEDRDTEPG